jgi:hypothetical protein
MNEITVLLTTCEIRKATNCQYQTKQTSFSHAKAMSISKSRYLWFSADNTISAFKTTQPVPKVPKYSSGMVNYGSFFDIIYVITSSLIQVTELIYQYAVEYAYSAQANLIFQRLLTYNEASEY